MNPRDDSRESFHADGREEWIESPDFRRQAQEAEDRVRRRFAPRLASAGPFRRIWLQLEMQGEIRREIEGLAPAEASWISPPRPDGRTPWTRPWWPWWTMRRLAR